MVPHRRSWSKGSFSLFSLDTIRSLSRAGSRQACRIPSKDELRDRAESSLSHRCDPYHQPPALPESDLVGDARTNPPPPKPAVTGEDHQIDETSPETPEPVVHKPKDPPRRSNRIRPVSWLPFSRSSAKSSYPRSASAQLPKASSTSTVARSVISAPVLTSTTNVSVARTEGVRCGEMSDLAFQQSNWNSQVGWVAASTENGGGEDVSIGKEREGPVSASSAITRIETLPKPPELKKRAILRLGDTIKNKFRSGSAQAQNIMSRSQQSSRTIEERAQPDAVASVGSISRRRAETANLCKDKIKGLTGNGHVRRKNLNTGQTTTSSQEDPPLLGEFVDIACTDQAAEQSDADSAPGSLTRSFASAVDKLDFHSTLPRNMPFLRSLSSLFDSKKRETELGDRGDTEQQASSILPLQLASPTTFPAATRALSGSPGRLPGAPGIVKETGPKAPIAYPTHAALAARPSGPPQLVFSGEKNAYVPATLSQGVARVNPLRMHPPDAFATPPASYQRHLEAPQPNTSNVLSASNGPAAGAGRASEDNDDSGSLEDAPIYSPSLGDLSQYARDTPPSTRVIAKIQPQDSSPTQNVKRNTAEGPGGLLKKSKSGVGLFSKSRQSSPPAMVNNSRSVPGSPLRQRDINQRVGGERAAQVKKSRSLHFGGLFKKESSPGLDAAVPPAPFQPATPSPLRNVMRVKEPSHQSTPGPQPSASSPLGRKK